MWIKPLVVWNSRDSNHSPAAYTKISKWKSFSRCQAQAQSRKQFCCWMKNIHEYIFNIFSLAKWNGNRMQKRYSSILLFEYEVLKILWSEAGWHVSIASRTRICWDRDRSWVSYGEAFVGKISSGFRGFCGQSKASNWFLVEWCN